ncbi:MAG TPA: Spy/CpxP family protein refolding chaperone [Polyangiaceae bacterium]|nr:Spy/CpxP family protein refolding chaperone [Polyangiaceae bacterium]
MNSPIRGLSEQEIDDLTNGRGMGLARAAELNGYPGPRHVLDLSAELELTSEQTTLLQEIFERMNAAARAAGQAVLVQEKALNQAFATRSIGAADLETRVQQLAEVHGQLRGTHLAAHLATQALLSPAQITKYAALRGYATGAHAHH